MDEVDVIDMKKFVIVLKSADLKTAWERAKWRLSEEAGRRVENEDLIRRLFGADQKLADLLTPKAGVRRAR